MNLTTYTAAERPGLWARGIESEDVWPEYNLHGDVLNRWWSHLETDLPDYQFVIYDLESDVIVAEGHSAPISWDGLESSLPSGIGATIESIFGQHCSPAPVNTLCALAAESPRGGRKQVWRPRFWAQCGRSASGTDSSTSWRRFGPRGRSATRSHPSSSM